MKALNGKVLLRVDNDQKKTYKIGDFEVSAALLWETNYREKSPTIAEVVSGKGELYTGDIILCHHNMFFLPSPYHVQDDLFSMPANATTVFCKIRSDGSLEPVFGNTICERIEKPSAFEVPPELKEYYVTKYKMVDPGTTTFKKGQTIFTRPHSGYEMVYQVGGEKRRTLRVNSEMICGYV